MVGRGLRGAGRKDMTAGAFLGAPSLRSHAARQSSTAALNSVNANGRDYMADDVRKSKRVTIRLTREDMLAIRDEAFSKGQGIGPMVELWIRPKIDRLKKAKAKK